MEIRFDKQYLEDLYLKGKSSDKKHRFQPQIITYSGPRSAIKSSLKRPK